MFSRVIGIGEVIELNRSLAEKSVNYKVHMHDTCGKQSFELRKIDETKSVSDEETKSAVSLVESYFSNKNIEIQFLDNQRDFYIL